jgi:hypothetical protein
VDPKIQRLNRKLESAVIQEVFGEFMMLAGLEMMCYEGFGPPRKGGTDAAGWNTEWDI